MKVFCLIFFVFCAAHQPLIAQQLNWEKDQKLSWEHFKGTIPPDRLSSQAAYLDYKIDFNFSGKMLNDSLVLSFEVTPVMLQLTSWADPARVNDNALAFEQLRFDLVALYAQKLDSALRNTAFTPSNAQQKVNETVKSYQDQLSKAVELYTSETFFGTRPKDQQRWREKLNEALGLIP